MENHSASRHGFSFRVTGYEETHLGPSQGVQRKMVITFWRIEAGRERFPMTQKLNDIMLSGIFLSDDQSGASRARV